MIQNIKILLKKILFKFPSIYRRIFIKSKIAFGERYWYMFQKNFLCVDHKESDFNINLEVNNKLPFKNVEQIFTSHMLEHITNEMGIKFLNQCYDILQKNGVIRIEVPDVEILINDYKGKKRFIKSVQNQNKKTLVDKYNFDEIYAEPHLALSSYLSLYIDPRGFHVPVKTEKKEFDNNLNLLSTDEFCEWLISLQTTKQKETHGHINWFNYNKIHDILKEIGFSKIERVYSGKTNNNFDLLMERSGERGEYSLILEAVK